MILTNHGTHLKDAFEDIDYAEIEIFPGNTKESVIMNRNLLFLFSPFLRHTIGSCFSGNNVPTTIIAPEVSTRAVDQLNRILLQGSTKCTNFDDKIEVMATAKILGITLPNLESEKEISFNRLPYLPSIGTLEELPDAPLNSDHIKDIRDNIVSSSTGDNSTVAVDSEIAPEVGNLSFTDSNSSVIVLSPNNSLYKVKKEIPDEKLITLAENIKGLLGKSLGMSLDENEEPSGAGIEDFEEQTGLGNNLLNIKNEIAGSLNVKPGGLRVRSRAELFPDSEEQETPFRFVPFSIHSPIPVPHPIPPLPSTPQHTTPVVTPVNSMYLLNLPQPTLNPSPPVTPASLPDQLPDLQHQQDLLDRMSVSVSHVTNQEQLSINHDKLQEEKGSSVVKRPESNSSSRRSRKDSNRKEGRTTRSKREMDENKRERSSSRSSRRGRRNKIRRSSTKKRSRSKSPARKRSRSRTSARISSKSRPSVRRRSRSRGQSSLPCKKGQNRSFTCPQCKIYETPQMEHMKQHNILCYKLNPQNLSLNCKLCTQVQRFNNPQKFHQHTRYNHGDQVVKCELCVFTSTHKQEIKEHIFKYHNGPPKPGQLEEGELYSCEICAYVSPLPSSVTQHKRDTHEKGKEVRDKSKFTKWPSPSKKAGEWRISIGWGPDDKFTCDNWNFENLGECRLDPGHKDKRGVSRNHVCALCFRHSGEEDKSHPAIQCQRFPLPPKKEGFVLSSRIMRESLNMNEETSVQESHNKSNESEVANVIEPISTDNQFNDIN